MKRLLMSVAALSLWTIAAGSLFAQAPLTNKPQATRTFASRPSTGKPVPAPELLPAPQEIPLAPQVIYFRIEPRPELGRRNIWELYSVNSRGQFVPRVAPEPEPRDSSSRGPVRSRNKL